MTTFAALGDSITVGVGDQARAAGPDGAARRGWAALLAEGLREPDLHILAADGACARDIERDQLPRALALRPDVASVVFGVNDTLRPGFDPDQIAESAAHIVGALRAAGAEVLTMRLPEPDRMPGPPGSSAAPLARRADAINSVMDGIAEQFGTLHVDAAGAATDEKRLWAADRLHPSEHGDRHIARCFHGLLAGAGYPVGPAPDPEPGNQPPAQPVQPGRLAAKRTAWVLSRWPILVPYLLAMAAREIYARRQRGDQLLPPVPGGSSREPDEGVAAVIDLARYRRESRAARAAGMTRNGPPRR
jgi:lysophospholipase L1-like esterase